MPDDSEPCPSETNAEPPRRRESAFKALRALLVPKKHGVRAITEDHILSVLASRRGREVAFGRELFCDPAWDILLELFAANLAGRRITQVDLARSLNLPPSALRRWAEALCQRGLIVLREESADRARDSMELSTEGVAAMRRLMNHWGSAFLSI